MGVLRQEGSRSILRVNTGASGGIVCRCPGCGMNMMIVEISSGTTAQCNRCNTPLIRRSEMMRIVSACVEAKTSGQIHSAVSILRFLSEVLPEAGTALGTLAGKHTLPLSEEEQWKRLVSAYENGDFKAQEWLDLMCKSSPARFERRICKSCGALMYVDRVSQGKALCSFCQSEG